MAGLEVGSPSARGCRSVTGVSLRITLIAGCSVLGLQSARMAQAQQPPTTLPSLSVEAPAAKKKQPSAKAKQRPPAQAKQTAPAPEPTPPPAVQATNPGGVTGYQATRTSTATKTNTPLIDVPQAISVVTKQQIEDQSAQSLADVVRYIPGITIAQGEGHRDAPIIRGQSSTADFFLNGIRDDVQYYRDFYNIDRVEVLRGPNAMIFGRGGGGGVINRVSKEAGWTPLTEVSATLGTFGERRATVDVNQPINDRWSVRINGLIEDSESYRDYFERKRYGFNPTITFAPDAQTRYVVSYEFFKDDGTTDRGIPSYRIPPALGRPVPTSRSQFFGNPDESYYGVEAHILRSHLQHWTDAGVKISNQTLFASYDKFYQNVYPTGVNPALTDVTLGAYNNQTDRTSIFNQTDISYAFDFGWMKHTVLVGAELSRQRTDNYRETGTFLGSNTVPYWNPVSRTPVVFAPTANDANSKSTVDVAAIYLQDQIDLGKHFQIIGGVRYDHVSVESFDKRPLATIRERERDDDLVSPRIGVVFKPFSALSLYASYSVSYLPYSGDQFAILDGTTVTLDPEKFTNYEIGAKWDIQPGLSLTAAAYKLNRTNTRMNDPNNPGQIIQAGETETEGFELTLTGQVTDKWQVVGGYGYQDAVVVRSDATPAGNRLALVPKNTFALWNKYQFTPSFAAGVGIIHQTDMYAGVDNVVVLPDFTRVDAALYFKFTDKLRGQVYVENLFDEKYFPTAHSNTNIMPGSPRAARFTLTSSF